MAGALQWGGRFSGAADPSLLAFGSSLEEDLMLAPFDVACSLAHVEALRGGGILDAARADALVAALRTVECEIASGSFTAFARTSGAEDVHGALDARVRDLAGAAGESLHAGRSRNDQVATTLLLYVRDRAATLSSRSRGLAIALIGRARAELEVGTVLAGCTHRQPAQPVLLAFVLTAWCEPFVRAVARFASVARSAATSCPLGSAALAGSSLPLDRAAAAAMLGFEAPSRNALDAIGTRDAALDLAAACVRAVVDASRIAEELIAWCTPASGFARLSDAAATGSSLMPQKHNPDPFELIRARASKLTGAFAGALSTLCGLAPSYQRDLQETKAQCMAIVEETARTLGAFERTLAAVEFQRARMEATALDGYTVATDVADAAIAAGASARQAHALAGAAVARAEAEGRQLDLDDLARLAHAIGVPVLDAPLDARASVAAKRTAGSTSPACVRDQIGAIERELGLPAQPK
jgi:argininosuccinate lyase